MHGFCCSKTFRYVVRNDMKTESSMKTLNPAVARVLRRLHYPLDVILTSCAGTWLIH